MGGGIRGATGSRRNPSSPLHRARPSASVASGDIAALSVNLTCSLEELYKGTTKNIRVSDIFSVGGRKLPVRKEFRNIKIRPHMRAGTRFTYPASKDFPKKVVFTLVEKPHRIFRRSDDGVDLNWVCRLTRKQLTKGVVVKLPMLDGSTFRIESKHYNIMNGTVLTFPEKGFVINSSSRSRTDTDANRSTSSRSSNNNNNEKRGKLLIVFNVIGY